MRPPDPPWTTHPGSVQPGTDGGRADRSARGASEKASLIARSSLASLRRRDYMHACAGVKHKCAPVVKNAGRTVTIGQHKGATRAVAPFVAAVMRSVGGYIEGT